MSYFEWENLYYQGLKEQKRLAKARAEGKKEVLNEIKIELESEIEKSETFSDVYIQFHLSGLRKALKIVEKYLDVGGVIK